MGIQDRMLDDYEMLLRKYGHAPIRGYVEAGQWQDGVRCLRCNYARRPTTDEAAIEPCLVTGAANEVIRMAA